jgi:hypothetical protein
VTTLVKEKDPDQSKKRKAKAAKKERDIVVTVVIMDKPSDFELTLHQHKMSNSDKALKDRKDFCTNVSTTLPTGKQPDGQKTVNENNPLTASIKTPFDQMYYVGQSPKLRDAELET